MSEQTQPQTVEGPKIDQQTDQVVPLTPAQQLEHEIAEGNAFLQDFMEQGELSPDDELEVAAFREELEAKQFALDSIMKNLEFARKLPGDNPDEQSTDQVAETSDNVQSDTNGNSTNLGGAPNQIDRHIDTRIPDMKSQELKKALGRLGYVRDSKHGKGSHEMWVNEAGHKVTVPRSVNPGFLKRFVKELGISPEEFVTVGLKRK